MANLFLPKLASWFRLDEHVRRLIGRVEALENNPAPSGDFIPLTGTESLSPVTGDIEMSSGTKVFSYSNANGGVSINYSPSQIKLESLSDTTFNGAVISLDSLSGDININNFALAGDITNQILMNSSGMYLKSYKDDGETQKFSRLSLLQDGTILVESDISEEPGPGLVADRDYSDQYVPTSFVQKSYVDNKTPFKVYKALLSQSGTGNPVPTVLHNTLGPVSFTRDVMGGYRANLTGAFTIGKTIYNVVAPEQSLGDGFKASIAQTNGFTGVSVNSLPFITYQGTTDNVKDNVLTGTAYIEIYVYN